MTEEKAARDLALFVKTILERKVHDPVVLAVGKLTSIADYFIICGGRSNRQVAAIAEHVEVSLKKRGVRPLSVEGAKDGQWALLDYGDVIIHVFFETAREFYDLEGLWADAPRVDISDHIREAEKAVRSGDAALSGDAVRSGDLDEADDGMEDDGIEDGGIEDDGFEDDDIEDDDMEDDGFEDDDIQDDDEEDAP